ncbi:MAG: HAD-IA family hydrolase [Nanoarchaeota archaeon]|nr:HAD-IA family hydrolase [Nanoarchaeota archaeon]
MNKRFGIIFDLDGTVIEPTKSITRCINYALSQKGYKEYTSDELLTHIGYTLYDVFPKLVGNISDEEMWELVELYRKRFDNEGIAENELYTGFGRLFKENAHKNLFIASLKPWPACKKILQHMKLDHYFKGIYGSENDGTRSDKTELVAYLKSKEGINDGVMVGDRESDIIAGKKNGLTTIGVTYGYGNDTELMAAGADFVVYSVEELNDRLKTLGGCFGSKKTT